MRAPSSAIGAVASYRAGWSEEGVWGNLEPGFWAVLGSPSAISDRSPLLHVVRSGVGVILTSPLCLLRG